MATSHTIVWQHATVESTRRLTDRITRIELRPDRTRRVEPGAHLDVRIELDGSPVTRSYSIVDSAADGSTLAVSVFRGDASRGGAAVMHALQPGDRVQVTSPLQDFPYRPRTGPTVFLAGGVGITAILGMARAARTAGADYRLVYCGRGRAHMAYLDEMIDEHGENLELHVKDEGTTADVEALVAGLDPGTELYMCGPIRLMDAVRRAWDERGLPASHLRFETFGNSGWFEAEPFRVRVPATGLECVVPPHQTMLEALEEAGADPLYDCRKGECGLCEARVAGLDGTIDHRDVFYSERQKDASTKICPCVSRVRAGDGEPMASIDLTLS